MLHISGSSEIHYVAKDKLEILVLLPSPPHVLESKCVPPYLSLRFILSAVTL